jgi:hypothetical protein
LGSTLGIWAEKDHNIDFYENAIFSQNIGKDGITVLTPDLASFYILN